jgi:hypothetical protein
VWALRLERTVQREEIKYFFLLCIRGTFNRVAFTKTLEERERGKLEWMRWFNAEEREPAIKHCSTKWEALNHKLEREEGKKAEKSISKSVVSVRREAGRRGEARWIHEWRRHSSLPDTLVYSLASRFEARLSYSACVNELAAGFAKLFISILEFTIECISMSKRVELHSPSGAIMQLALLFAFVDSTFLWSLSRHDSGDTIEAINHS